MANEEGRKENPTDDLGSLLGGFGFLSEEESKKLADTLFAPERERWQIRYDTLDALKEIAAIQSQQSKTLSDLARDTERDARSQNKVNRVLVWLTGSGLVVAVLSLLAFIAISLGFLHPLNK